MNRISSWLGFVFFKKFAWLAVVLVLGVFGCDKLNSESYTIHRHLKSCVEVVDQGKWSKRLRDRKINQCMNTRGHKDFDVEAYRELKGTDI